MIELDVQSSKKGQGRESLQSPLKLLYSLVGPYLFDFMLHGLNIF